MAPCHPPLNFVQNGAAGSAFPPPLDPTPPQFGPPSPTFEESACTLLGADLCSAMDPISAIDELPALADAVDALTKAADSNLDAILLELDQLGQQQVHDSFDAFAAAQPGETSLLGTADALAVPAIGQIPLVLPSGAAAITFGGPPETGGVARAGGAAYTRHLELVPVGYNVQDVKANGGQGANPPFAQWGAVVQEKGADGREWWVYHVTINPAHAGAFTGTAEYLVHATVAGITGTFHVSKVFQVVVE